MSGFEFFFSLYGLVLGLSVVEITAGFARLVHNREPVKVGWLVPALAVLMLLDLAHFWLNAFETLQSYEPSYAMLVIGLLISALYYVAASAVFPKDFKAEPVFDEVYLRHRRLVLGLMTITGMLAFEALPSLSAAGRAARWEIWSTGQGPILFFVCIAVIFASRVKWVNLVALFVLTLQYLYVFASSFQ